MKQCLLPGLHPGRRPRLAWRHLLLLGLSLGLSSPLAQAQFGPATPYPTGSESFPRSLALGDVTGDGRPDIAVILGGSNTIGILPGLPAGFGAVTGSYALGTGAHNSVVLADVNLDGRLDLVTTNNANSAVEVLPGLAGGGFGPFSAYPTGNGSFPQGLAVADVNGDGRPDVVTANTDVSTVAVLLGQAAGGFASVATYNTGTNTQPATVALGDVNGDGRPDIVTGNSGNNTVGVLLGQTGGTFGAAMSYATGANAFTQGVTLADLNADGRLDAVAANQNGNNLAVLLGHVSGGFAPVVPYSTGLDSAPRQVAIGDVNGDGRPDLVTANSAAGNDRVAVLLGQTGGTFAAAATYSTGLGSAPRSIALRDVSGDGRLDIITVHAGTYGLPPDPNILTGGHMVSVLLNLGTFPLAAAAPVVGPPLELYPNPAQWQLTVRRPPGAANAAVLLNNLGQVVHTLALPTTETTCELAGLPPGVYTLRLQVSGQPVARRVVLQ